jgi:hypothetical protein
MTLNLTADAVETANTTKYKMIVKRGVSVQPFFIFISIMLLLFTLFMVKFHLYPSKKNAMYVCKIEKTLIF